MDTSALIKLYLPEIGSAWLSNYITNQSIIISQLALFETANTTRRLYVEGRYTRDEALDLIAQVLRDTTSYQIVPLGNEPQLNDLISLIFGLPLTLRIRTLDSVHLRVAQVAFETANTSNPPQPFVFISADQKLINAAHNLGFQTENLQDHP